MKTLALGNITIEIDKVQTQKFYETQNGFSCTCPDCLNYLSKISDVQILLNGIDATLGIDLTKDVGQGMDELRPHDYKDHHLYLIPYYVIGQCRIEEKNLKNNKELEYKLTDKLSILIKKASNNIEINGAKNILTIWLVYKTELIKK